MDKEEEDLNEMSQDNNTNVNRIVREKRKRRSKHDYEGRSFRCPECGKSYLSMPALTNHRKAKHDYGKFGERKGRGRPRKEPLIINPIDSTEKKFKNFFEKEFRKLIPGEKIDYDQIDLLLKNIVTLYKTHFAPLKIEQYHKYPFFNLIFSNWENFQSEYEHYAYDEEDNLTPKNPKTIDFVLVMYLKECSTRTCLEYFETILKFVVLFREGINTIKQNEKEKEREKEVIKDKNRDTKRYTEKYNSQEVPDVCNAIIQEFFEPNCFFGLDTKDLEEIIQHICYWMFNNNYTTSRLTIA